MTQWAQSGLLAQRDSLTPLLCVAAQCALNVTGDVVLIGRCGWGLAGAAWATALSQWAAVAGLLLALADQKQVLNLMAYCPQCILSTLLCYVPAVEDPIFPVRAAGRRPGALA